MQQLDTIVRDLAERYGLGAKARPLVSAAFSLITDPRFGGLSAFVERFEEAGMAELAKSWVARGENQPLTVSQVEKALGRDVIGRFAGNVGVAPAGASSALAVLIPKAVDLLTPDGEVSANLPGWVGPLLNGNFGLAPGSTGAAGSGATGRGPSAWAWQLPALAAVAIAGFLSLRACAPVGASAPEHRSELMSRRADAARPGGEFDRRWDGGASPASNLAAGRAAGRGNGSFVE